MTTASRPALRGLLGIMLFFLGAPPGFPADLSLSVATQECLKCHGPMSPSLVESWRKSSHARQGIGCYECHQASPTDPDAIPDHNGHTISTLVTPKDCGRCHAEQAATFAHSRHASAALLLREPDGQAYDGRRGDVFLGGVMQGMASFLNGCESCHGTRVAIDPDTHLPMPRTYPNHGVGRINPDGSVGACSACHQRHEFRIEATRQPGVCGRCHLGPDHPQLEIWKESKHGITFKTTNDLVDLNRRPLLLGRHPVVVPSCATCHLGGTIGGTAQTHDPGTRISWRTGPEVSPRTPDWPDKRLAMFNICANCHSMNLITSYYEHLDKAVALYNKKFAEPALEILDRLRQAGKLDPSPFNEKIERIWLFLWHHEGRRARMGAAMMGPDYVQWQGFYQVALGFYFEFLPEAERLSPGITTEIMARPEHRWLQEIRGSKEEVEAAIQRSIRFWLEQKPDPTANRVLDAPDGQPGTSPVAPTRPASAP